MENNQNLNRQIGGQSRNKDRRKDLKARMLRADEYVVGEFEIWPRSDWQDLEFSPYSISCERH